MKIKRKCPVCGRYYRNPPALSRKDNRTEICPECGMMEALAAVQNFKEKQKVSAPAERKEEH